MSALRVAAIPGSRLVSPDDGESRRGVLRPTTAERRAGLLGCQLPLLLLLLLLIKPHSRDARHDARAKTVRLGWPAS